MEYQRKKASSELQQTQLELDMAQVNDTLVHADNTHVHPHACMHRHTKPHHTTHTDTPHAHPPTSATPILLMWFTLVISRLLKPITRRSYKSIWAVPMETSYTHEEKPFSKQVCIQLHILALYLNCDL